jgi:hypothetical protein
VASIASSLRYLFADVIGEDDAALPFLPDNLPDRAAPIVGDAILLLADYQSASHAQLYVDRLKRFVGRPGVDAALFCEIARLMAVRMSYQDPIRIAQLKLAESGDDASGTVDEVMKLRLDELIGALPAPAADPLLDVLGRIGWLRKRVAVRFSAKNRFGIRRLKLEASLRRWRQFSVRYNEERIWVERWLHMIARCLDKQPPSVAAVVQTATMIEGHGDPYRQGLIDWHLIIDGLAKPTFDGVLPLVDLAAAITEARTACMPDPRQAALKRVIAQIRAQASGTDVAAG